MVVDEAHVLNNAQGNSYKTLNRIRASLRLLLNEHTGRGMFVTGCDSGVSSVPRLHFSHIFLCCYTERTPLRSS